MKAMIDHVDRISHSLMGDYELLPDALCLQLLDQRLNIRSNSAALLERLRAYFAHVLVPPDDQPEAEVIAIERDVVDLKHAFTDWQREPGKTGRKDAIHDFVGGRLVRKVRTGMLFLQSQHRLIAAGPCLEHDNQVINFVNSQFLNSFQNLGYLLCHAAALSRDGYGLAIAGLSGGGKSTLMLNLLEDAATRYVTNDRLLVRAQSSTVDAVGIPKLPRINPGTIVNNPRLHPLMDQSERLKLAQLDTQALWRLEQKYDVDIGALYGPGRVQHQTKLQKFLVLNWQHDHAQKLQVMPAALEHRPELLAAIMKPSGPFFLDADGRFNRDDALPHPAAYLAALQNVEIFEACGRVDFADLGAVCLNELMA